MGLYVKATYTIGITYPCIDPLFSCFHYRSSNPKSQWIRPALLKQANHSWGQATSVFQASEESGLFIFPSAWTVTIEREHLGHTGQTWKKNDHCDYMNVVTTKRSSEELLCLKTQQLIPHSLWQCLTADEVFCIYFSTQAPNFFSCLSDKVYLF